MNPSSLFQFIIGFFLGVILFGAGIAGGAYFFLTTVAGNPSKPVFEEEKVSENKAEKSPPQQTKAEEKPTPVEEKKETDDTEKLPDGAYKAKVTWSTGLSLRSEPSKDAQRVGGIDYNTEIIVLTTSNDNQWQKIRIPSSGEEGWVKAGNTAKIE